MLDFIQSYGYTEEKQDVLEKNDRADERPREDGFLLSVFFINYLEYRMRMEEELI